MSYNYFNPSTANDLARFQGTLAGIQAGNASYTGVATAPTSIYNQAGYHAFSNDNGTISLIKDADESLFTKKWYDQTSNTTFDFSGTQSTNNSSSANSTDSTGNSQGTTTTSNNNTTTDSIKNGADTAVNNQTTTPAASNNSVDNSSSNSNGSTDSADNNDTQSVGGENTNTDNDTGLQSYPWGNGYVSIYNTTDNNTSNNQGTVVDENGEQVEINAQDINDLVDAGAYSNVSEALNDLKNSGYKIPDDEQAKLGIYTEDSEKMITTMMDKLDISRDEAINKLSDKLQTNEGVKIGTEEEYYNAYQNLVDRGMSDEEATSTLEKLGYETPSAVKDLEQLDGYSNEDQEKILTVMQSTGCSAQDAINSLGVKKEEHHGVIRSIGDFFCGLGQGIADCWNGLCSWIW